jgi:hypothetical protein
MTGNSIEITPEGSSLINFTHGWHSELEGDSHSPHRWSVDMDAAIQIPKISTSPLRKGLVHVELDAIPYLPARGPGHQDVLISLDGAMVAGIRLYRGEVKTFSGHFVNPINYNSFSQIRFFLPHSARPSRLDDGPDERDLGIALRKLKIELS